MDIECICEPYDGEAMDWSSESWQRAAKEYKCCECKETILRGERYHRIVGSFEGSIETLKTCEFCATERERLNREHPDMPVVLTELACWLVAELRGDL